MDGIKKNKKGDAVGWIRTKNMGSFKKKLTDALARKYPAAKLYQIPETQNGKWHPLYANAKSGLEKFDAYAYVYSENTTDHYRRVYPIYATGAIFVYTKNNGKYDLEVYETLFGEDKYAQKSGVLVKDPKLSKKGTTNTDAGSMYPIALKALLPKAQTSFPDLADETFHDWCFGLTFSNKKHEASTTLQKSSRVSKSAKSANTTTTQVSKNTRKPEGSPKKPTARKTIKGKDGYSLIERTKKGYCVPETTQTYWKRL